MIARMKQNRVCTSVRNAWTGKQRLHRTPWKRGLGVRTVGCLMAFREGSQLGPRPEHGPAAQHPSPQHSAPHNSLGVSSCLLPAHPLRDPYLPFPNCHSFSTQTGGGSLFSDSLTTPLPAHIPLISYPIQPSSSYSNLFPNHVHTSPFPALVMCLVICICFIIILASVPHTDN